MCLKPPLPSRFGRHIAIGGYSLQNCTNEIGNSLLFDASWLVNVASIAFAHQCYTFASGCVHYRYRTWSNERVTNRVLRIGYLSADFFTHSVSYFIEAPLSFADRSKTHVICYSNVARRDKKTQHLEKLAHEWREVHDKNAKQVAELIRQDKIDILVELTGHTAGNRLDVMALKPAPIQVTWIGYPNTTGLPTIDYRFTDEIVDPFDTKQQYSETLVRFKGPFLCYTPPADAPAVAETPALVKGYVTFGSFNNLAKVNDAVLRCWCTILQQVEGSRMLIKCKPFASLTVCQKVLKRFADYGIDSDRVDLISLLPTTAEHLASYANIDISVDTFPYAGTTTTCEALFMGVPVVTYKKTSFPNHAHNVGATLLSRIKDMDSLIATSEKEYIDIAVRLAKDLPRLSALRASLRENMLRSPICDGTAFVRNLENTYQMIWDRYVATPELPSLNSSAAPSTTGLNSNHNSNHNSSASPTLS